MKHFLVPTAFLCFVCLYQTAWGWSYWSYNQIPQGPQQAWHMNQPGRFAGIFIDQARLPGGYLFRVHLAGQQSRDIIVSVEGGALVIRSDQTQQSSQDRIVTKQFAGFTQWLTVPADSDANRMTLSMGPGVLNIYLPRRQ